MTIWIFNHYAQGPNLPGGTRHFDHAKALLSRGHKVTIFAAGFHYTLFKEMKEYNGKDYMLETVEGVDFVWVKTSPYQKNDFRRLINVASYAWRLNTIIPRLILEKPDVVIGSVVHPFAPLLAQRLAQKQRVPFVFEIRDLWPQTFIDMGIWGAKSLKSRFFRWIEKICVERSDAIIALSPLTQEYIKQHYSGRESVYIPNGVDLQGFEHNYITYRYSNENETIDRLRNLKNSGKFIAMFTGAIVQSNNIDFIVESVKAIKNEKIHLVIVGKGQERENVERKIREEKLINIEILDPVEKYLVPVMLEKADLLVLVQGKVQWGSTNKLFDYMASGKPILTALYAGHNNVVTEAKCGFSALPEDRGDFSEKLETMASMKPDELEELGRNAIRYVQEHNTIELLSKQLESELLKLVNKENWR